MLENFISTQKPGTKVKLSVVHNGATHAVTAKLGSLGS